MKLFVSETKVQDAVIPIRWCLNRKELEELKERGAENPHLLLVTVHDKKEVDRYLIPLNQMLAYIQFHKPGENRILATVAWWWEGKTDKLKGYFLERSSYGGYEHSILDYEKKNFHSDLEGHRLGQQTEITVVVPAELFAKEPPSWERKWVNLWFETRSRDQCQYRRRRMIAYTIQPPLVLLFTVFISVFRFLAASVLLFLGKRGVDLKPIIHPFWYHSDDVWKYTKASVFSRNAKGKKRHWLITFFSPPVFLGFLAIVIGARFIFPSLFPLFTLQWWYYPLGALIVMVGIAVVVYALFALVFFIPYSLATLILRLLKVAVVKPWSEQRKARWEQAREKKEEKEWKETEKRRRVEEQRRAELEQLLACDGEFTPKLSALPKEKQTFYLRFQDLKARVCKPYAR
ncbi:MAG: hypothetical protein ACOZAL_02120 [Patescibacteria group bacterium]